MDAPKRIWAWPDRGRRESVTGRWSCNTYSSDLTEAYILAAEHERLLSEARNKALEDAARMLLRKFRSTGLIEDFAAAILAMKGGGDD